MPKIFIQMAFGFNNKKLRVEFFDSVTEKMIGFDEMARKSLPDDFKVATWVEIAGNKYKVEQVLPDSIRKAFKKGTMTVHLKLEESAVAAPLVAPKAENLFKNPSKADHTPRFSGLRGELKLLEIAASEWRDLEFTLASNRSLVEEAFEKIEAIILTASTVQDGKTFFRQQHKRDEIILPLRGQKLALEALKTDFFPFAASLDGLTFMGESGIADHTFVFRSASGLNFYGQEFEGLIRYLGLKKPNFEMPDLLRSDVTKLVTLMKRKELILVDWANLMLLEAEEKALKAFFLGESASLDIPEVEAVAPIPEVAEINPTALEVPAVAMEIVESITEKVESEVVEANSPNIADEIESSKTSEVNFEAETVITEESAEKVEEVLEAKTEAIVEKIPDGPPSLDFLTELTPEEKLEQLDAEASKAETIVEVGKYVDDAEDSGEKKEA